jgi:hypothetical protein
MKTGKGWSQTMTPHRQKHGAPQAISGFSGMARRFVAEKIFYLSPLAETFTTYL